MLFYKIKSDFIFQSSLMVFDLSAAPLHPRWLTEARGSFRTLHVYTPTTANTASGANDWLLELFYLRARTSDLHITAAAAAKHEKSPHSWNKVWFFRLFNISFWRFVFHKGSYLKKFHQKHRLLFTDSSFTPVRSCPTALL